MAQSKYFRPFRNNKVIEPNIIEPSVHTIVSTNNGFILPCSADPEMQDHHFLIECYLKTVGTGMPMFSRFASDGNQWAEVHIFHGAAKGERYKLVKNPVRKLNMADKHLILWAIHKFTGE